MRRNSPIQLKKQGIKDGVNINNLLGWEWKYENNQDWRIIARLMRSLLDLHLGIIHLVSTRIFPKNKHFLNPWYTQAILRIWG